MRVALDTSVLAYAEGTNSGEMNPQVLQAAPSTVDGRRILNVSDRPAVPIG